MNLSVLGAGAWGTALAASVCRRNATQLWARDLEHAADIRRGRENARYLPGIVLPDALDVVDDLASAVAHAAGGLLVVATPLSGLADTLVRLRGASAGIVWLCKGFEQRTGALPHEVAARLVPGARVGVLSGPSFAIEVARGQPTALVAASHDAALLEQTVHAVHGDKLRVYTTADPVGVEVGGALKNVYAIASGIADGMPASGDRSVPGQNARAALVTRGLAEMTRLGVALGARAETFMGLSGLGDLVLTTTGDLSRNRQVGLMLAAGRPLARILAELGHVAEGVATAPMALKRAHAAGVEMPIAEAVAAVIEGRATPAAALERLMGRDARSEQ